LEVEKIQNKKAKSKRDMVVYCLISFMIISVGIVITISRGPLRSNDGGKRKARKLGPAHLK